MKISVNKKIINKNESGNKSELNNFSEVVEMTSLDLIESIRNGYAHSNLFINGVRRKENFEESWVVQLDFDSGMSWEEALSDPFFKDKASFIYTTVSHTDEKPRLRAVFTLKEPIKDSKTYESAVKGLLKKYPQADSSCKDCPRIFYGNTNAVIHEFGAELSSGDVELLVQLNSHNGGMKAITHNLHNERPLINTNNERFQQKSHYSEYDVGEMLKRINPMPGYGDWVKYIWVVRSEFDDEATLRIINQWSPDDCNGQKIRQVIRDYKPGYIGIDCLVKQVVVPRNGTSSHLDKTRMPGQVVFQDLFKSGNGCIAIHEVIYEYKDGYYQEIPDNEARSMIANHFNGYITSDGKNSFATKSKIDDALNTCKDLLNLSKNKVINPPGLNLKNGFRALSYDDKGKPYFRLEPHSANRICLTKSDVEYHENTDGTEFERVISNILPNPEKKVLLGLISSAFDLKEIRKKHSRTVKALILLGDGSNGKDTIRAWITGLFGPEAVTSVTLQSFKEKDSNRFNLFPLVNSLINWPSENASISLDNCEKLKAAITGDSLSIEKKHKDSFDHNPSVVFLFNSNHYPHIGGSQAALETRYAAIHFNNCFKRNPNPNNPNEKKADSRLKDDPEYISREILPGLLKCLEEAFIEVHDNGIDYTACDEMMTKLKDNSSHIPGFIKEYGLEVIKSWDEALPAPECYNKYLEFCRTEDFVRGSGDAIKYQDPSDFDKVRRSSGDLLKALKKYLPTLDSSKHAGKRVWNIRFNIAEPDNTDW